MRNWKRHILIAAAAALAGACGAYTNAARATTYSFDTTTGTLNSSQSGQLFGGSFSEQTVADVATYTFDTNVDFQAGDVINVTGNNPLDIVSYNDIVIPTGVTINVSASGISGVAGGGNGGTGGAGGAGGAGGVEALPTVPSVLRFNPYSGGIGGAGGALDANGYSGANGVSTSQYTGNPGGTASSGTSGNNGTPGLNNTAESAGGAGGAIAGAGGAVGIDGNGGVGGAGAYYTGGITSSITGAAYGGNGGYGKTGATGQVGANGFSGADGSNSASGLILSAGTGGAGGGGGQGGGGGGAGGEGGGGGGGGGGAGGPFQTGDRGGLGGGGGLGGSGAAGGTGGIGGVGGAGGGAFELQAMGRLTVAGNLLAMGGSGGAGGMSGARGARLEGSPGSNGLPGGVTSSAAYADGAYGGNGGNGGTGGSGGYGGNGGMGGAGAGGTIMLVGSVVNANGAGINTSGGDGSLGNDGRFVIGTNGTSPTGATITGAQQQVYTGPTGINTYVRDRAVPQTPLIADLAGGIAAPYGILANLTTTDPSIAGLTTNAPKNAMAAVILDSTGLPGYSDVFPGFQWVFLANISGKALNGVRIGFETQVSDPTNLPLNMNPLFQEYVLPGTFGFNTNELRSLNPDQIFAFLAPTAFLNSETMAVTSEGTSNLFLQTNFGVGTVGYLTATPSSVPEPGTLAIAIACGSLLLMKRRTRKEVK